VQPSAAHSPALRKLAIMPASRSRAARSSAADGCAGSCGMAEAGMPSVRASAAICGEGGWQGDGLSAAYHAGGDGPQCNWDCVCIMQS